MGKQVLIVDDSSMTRSIIRTAVEDIDDLETVEVANGFEALRVLPSTGIDLIITDINMPDINGLELINFIKKDPRFNSIPLVIISTETSDEDKQRGLRIGADSYLTKPFTAEEVQDTIRALLLQ
ncbi:MAG TPA: response regulator [Nitrospirae bacterium]|nr:response regulator [Nitrospirota bacterium]